MRSIHTIFWRAAAVCVIAAAAACGSNDEAALYKVRRAVERNAEPEKIADLLNGVRAFSPEFSQAIHTSLFMSSDWEQAYPSVLKQLREANAETRAIETRAKAEEIDNREAQTLRLLNSARDMAAERLAAFLATRPDEELRKHADWTAETALLAGKALHPQALNDSRQLLQTLGESARPFLLKALESGDPTARAQAVYFLGRLQNAEDVEPLRRRIGLETAAEPLYELPGALYRINAPEAARALMETLRLNADGSYAVGSARARAQAADLLALELLRRPALVGEAVPTLIQRLGDDNAYVIERASAALISLRDASIPPLLELLEGGWETARLSAVAVFDPDREASRRRALFAQAADVLVNLREATVMSKIQRKRALAIFADAFANDDLRSAASSALQAFGNPSLPLLMEYLDDADIRIRAAAVKLLGNMNDLNAAPALLKRVENEREAEAQAAVIAALETMRPREAVERVDKVLLSARDPRVRLAAVSALSAFKESGSTEWLLAAVDRETAVSRGYRESARAAAVGALSRIKPSGAPRALLTVLLDEKEPDTLRKAAALALGELGADAEEAAPAMREILRIGREDQKDFLRRIKQLYGNENRLNDEWKRMGWTAGYRSFREVKAIPSLARTEIVHAYRKIKGAEAEEALVETLQNDQSAAVRKAAALALREIAKGKEALMDAMLNDDVGSVRAACASAMEKHRGEDAVRALLKAIREDDYETTRVNAAHSLREIKLDSTVRGLTDVLTDRDLDMSSPLAARARASLILAGAQRVLDNGADSAAPLLPALRHPNAQTRAAAIDILARIKAPQTYDEALRIAKEDESASARERAVEALGRIRLVKAAEPLQRILGDEKERPRIRAAAAWSLGASYARGSAPALIEALEAAHPDIRAAAASALGQIRDEKASEALSRVALRRSEDEATRIAAIDALGLIGGEMAVDALYELLPREVGLTRLAVLRAVGNARAEEAAGALARTLESRAEPSDARIAAAVSLGQIGGDRASRALADRLLDPMERALGQIEAVDHYIFWEAAARAAQNLPMPRRLLSALQTMTEDEWAPVAARRHAPRPMGRIPGTDAAAALLDIIENNEDKHIRAHAIASLGYAGGTRAGDTLIDLLTNAGSVEERRNVPLALGEMRHARAAEPLKEAFENDADAAVQRNALKALIQVGEYAFASKKIADEQVPLAARLLALQAIADEGARAQAALPAVLPLLDAEDGLLAFRAWEASAAIENGDGGGAP